MAYPRNILPADWTRLLCAGVAGSALALGTAYAQDTATMTRGQLGAAEGAAKLAKGEDDDPHVNELPAANGHRVYVNDPAHFAAITQQFIVDADKGEVLGIVDGGFLPNPVVSDDGSVLAQVSTVFSRVARGTRTDYVEVFDPKTLNPVADIELPNNPRFLVGTYPWMSTLTPDNKSLLFYQFSPAPAVGLVNIADKKFDRMIDVPDCYHIFPTSNDTFFMHCRDGSLAKVEFGGAETKVSHTEVFRPEDDHLINHPAYSMKAQKLYWPTYTGKVYNIDLAGGEAKFGEPFEALTEAERKDGWAPGGWQGAAFSRGKDRLYLLVDQRAEWTHKTPSRFLVVIDTKTGKRVSMIELGHDIDSVNVSQEKEGAQIYGLSTGDRTLYVYDEETGKELRSINQLGHGPQVVTVSDMES